MYKYKRNYVNPRVDLVDTNNINSGLYVWLKSRRAILRDENNQKIDLDINLDNLPDKFYIGKELVEKEVYFNRVNFLNLQFNNMPFYTLEIDGSCLFRDLLFNINKLSQWAESNRFLFSILPDEAVTDSIHYKISSEYKDIPEWENQFDTYIDKINNTQITDENRIEMPYSINSTFWITGNKKSLINIISMLKLKMPFFYEIYGKMMMESLNLKETDLVRYVDAGLEQYFNTNKTSGRDVKYVGDFAIVTMDIGLILFSQFLRQADTITSGFFNELEHNDSEEFKHRVFKGDTVINIVHISHISKIKRTMTNRLCNFAQHSGNGPNSWTHFIELFMDKWITTTDEFKRFLPCIWNEDGSFKLCKFHDDVKFRKEGLESRNTICPLIDQDLELAKIKMKRDNNKIAEWYYKLTKKLVEGNSLDEVEELFNELFN